MPFTNLAHPIFERASKEPASIALLDGDTPISYGDLASRIFSLSIRLKALDLQSGDRIGLLQYNTPGYVVAYFASLCLGLIAVPLNTRLTGPELETILSDAGARFLITSTDFKTAISHIFLFFPISFYNFYFIIK